MYIDNQEIGSQESVHMWIGEGLEQTGNPFNGHGHWAQVLKNPCKSLFVPEKGCVV